jgi:hypothetical protein
MDGVALTLPLLVSELLISELLLALMILGAKLALLLLGRRDGVAGLVVLSPDVRPVLGGMVFVRTVADVQSTRR